MTVTATYDNEQTADVTEHTSFTGYDMSTIGTQTVTVSYTENEVTKTATYTIEVKAPATLTSISLSGNYATEFATGSTFSYDGMIVTASYDDETSKEVTGYTVSTPNLTTAGTKTVTVTYTENNVTKTATYNITVYIRQANDFVKVTDASTLRVGDQLILVYEDGVFAMGEINSGGKYFDKSETFTITNNTISDPSGVAILTLGGEDGAWTLKSSLSNKYLSLSSYSNELKESDAVNNNTQKWTITITGDKAKIKNKYYPTKDASDNTERYIQWNSSSPRFACYAGTQKPIAIYRLSQSVSITSACYATYCGSKALNFDALGITAYTATDNGSYVKLTEITSGQIPANTPVVLYKEGGCTVNVPVIAEADEITSTNDLRVVNEENFTGDNDVYVLANVNGTVGFYLWDSSATLNEGKVYLQGSGNGARTYLPFDEATGISETASVKNDSNVTYDLQGRRVVKAQKGLYIVNGKKVIMK